MKLTENQKAWVDALRSGEFKQSKFALENDDGYCCLGVLCVLAEKHGVGVVRGLDGLLHGSTMYEQPTARQWVGLADYNGAFFTHYDQPLALTELNDGGTSFEEIADIIERNAESLFL